MTKQFFSLGLILNAFFAQSAIASDQDGLICRLENNKDDPKVVRLISYDIDIMRLRFTGLEPDRYFSNTGKWAYTQFATKKNTVSPLENKIVATSTITREIMTGGEKFTWKNGSETKKYICRREN
jgi:hypothetical protein